MWKMLGLEDLGSGGVSFRGRVGGNPRQGSSSLIGQCL